MSTLKNKYLRAVDWALTLEIRVLELWISAFSLLCGMVFLTLTDSVKVIAFKDYYFVSPGSWKLYGGILIFAAIINFAGLAISLCHRYRVSRALRWTGSMLAATVWGACWLMPPRYGFNAAAWSSVYELLFFQRLWIALSLVYRGTRGNTP